MKFKDLVIKREKYDTAGLTMVVLITHLRTEHGLSEDEIKDLFTRAMNMDDEVLQKFMKA